MQTKEKITPGGEVILYKSEDGSLAIDVKLEKETVWLTPVQMAKLFDKARPTILEHIKNAYDEQELERESTCRKFRQVQIEGNRKITRQFDYYNLDVIISVGYRVKSKRGTQFRIWANKVLKDYLIKGYALNEKKLREQIGKEKNNSFKSTLSNIYQTFGGKNYIRVLKRKQQVFYTSLLKIILL